jgi:hypothetical protein
MPKPNRNRTPAKNSKTLHVPLLRVKKGHGLKEIYAAARRSFSAADLQKYTDVEEGIPLERVIADMESIQQSQNRKRRHKKA